MIILIFYILYMFLFFKTNISINHPLEYYIIDNLTNYFKHPISNSNYESKICPFGKDIIWVLVIYLFYKTYYPINKTFNRLVIFMTFILSLLNFNALTYLIPYFIYEYLI